MSRWRNEVVTLECTICARQRPAIVVSMKFPKDEQRIMGRVDDMEARLRSFVDEKMDEQMKFLEMTLKNSF